MLSHLGQLSLNIVFECESIHEGREFAAAITGGLFPSYCPAHTPHPGQFFLGHWTKPLGLERFVHSLLIGGAGHAHIHGGVGKHEAVAIRCSGYAFAGRNAFGIQ